MSLGVLAASANEFDITGEVATRLLIATLLGAIIGLEREAADQDAGLRTHIAICLGACLFGVVSTLGFDEFFARRETINVQVDVTRVASQVVVGISFLGAGVIFRRGNTIKNLTTAASMWTVCAVGLTCGVGDLGTATIATVIMLLALALLRPVSAAAARVLRRPRQELRLVLADGARPEDVLQRVRQWGEVELCGHHVEKENGRLVLMLQVAAVKTGGDVEPRITELAEMEVIDTLSVE